MPPGKPISQKAVKIGNFRDCLVHMNSLSYSLGKIIQSELNGEKNKNPVHLLWVLSFMQTYTTEKIRHHYLVELMRRHYKKYLILCKNHN